MDFFASGAASDETFRLYRDEPMCAGIREAIENLWRKYQPLCPDREQHFLKEARAHFHQRTWEMYLACTLLEHGLSLRRTRPEGPDICIDTDPCIWIEAIAVGEGSGADRVKTRSERAFHEGRLPEDVWHGEPPSEDSVILRCTSALAEKREKFTAYRRKEIVKPSEPCVVAISLAAIPDAHLLCNYREIPILIRALFGIGPDILRVSKDGSRPPELVQLPRPIVRKASGAEVPSAPFASDKYSDIAGVLGTSLDIVNAMWRHGSDLMFVNNPQASAIVAPGTFHIGTEFVATLNPEIRRHEWDRQIW